MHANLSPFSTGSDTSNTLIKNIVSDFYLVSFSSSMIVNAMQIFNHQQIKLPFISHLSVSLCICLFYVLRSNDTIVAFSNTNRNHTHNYKHHKNIQWFICKESRNNIYTSIYSVCKPFYKPVINSIWFVILWWKYLICFVCFLLVSYCRDLYDFMKKGRQLA